MSKFVFHKSTQFNSEIQKLGGPNDQMQLLIITFNFQHETIHTCQLIHQNICHKQETKEY